MERDHNPHQRGPHHLGQGPAEEEDAKSGLAWDTDAVPPLSGAAMDLLDCKMCPSSKAQLLGHF